MFLSQRNRPQLAQLIVQPIKDGLSLSFDGQTHHAAVPQGPRIDVTVWKSTVNAPLAPKSVNQALSDWLGEAVRLVYMDAQATRAVSEDWALGHETSFSDGYPLLVVNTATLDAVNAHIQGAGFKPISMARFRPNIVIDTSAPYAEDDWKSLSLGEVQIDLVKPCTRCVVTTLDPLTGQSQPEPVIDALKALRMSRDPRNKGVLFGVNAVVRRGGHLDLEQEVRAIT